MARVFVLSHVASSLHICQLCLANRVYNAVVIFAGPKRAQTTQTCCGAEFWLMFTNFFWTTDTDIMHPALSNMNCSIAETVDWVNNVIEILGPKLNYCLCSEECHLLGNVWWGGHHHEPLAYVRRYVLIMMTGDHEEIITMLFNASKTHNDPCKIIWLLIK